LTDQTKEIDGLKVAIAASLASAAPVDQTLVAQLQAEHVALGQREQLLFALQSGVLMPGWGHSDRLQLVARSIPDAVWVTEVRAESSRLQVIGFTFEPAALNEWVDKLSVSPLMRGLKLATVQVENTATTATKRPAAVASEAGASAGRPMWSFDLVSAPPEPLPVVAGTGSATKGVKP
jgi:Tfp pilus assembly protein PilN